MSAIDSPAAPTTPGTKPQRYCENCGQPLYGEHCHACGQPTKGMVRHFSTILGDFFDTVLNVDSRVLRTLWPLLTRPGYLTLEYFAGRRVRYVTPMRLYLFLSVIAFFAMQTMVSIDSGSGNTIAINNDSGDEFSKARSPAEVQQILTAAENKLAKARAQTDKAPGAAAALELAQAKVRERAQQQTEYLKQVEAAKAAGSAPPKPPRVGGSIEFPVNGKSWDPVSNPFTIDFLPGAVNASINHRLGHARDVLQASDSQQPLVDAIFRVSPQVLFVLMPIFALMLKIAYLFKRRLYMEHLIVALHSHSFISLALSLVFALISLQDWLAPATGALKSIFGLAIAAFWIWMPVYLLVMQKRVYGQGWPMTLVKYSVLGISYTVLLSFGLLAALLVGLLTL